MFYRVQYVTEREVGEVQLDGEAVQDLIQQAREAGVEVPPTEGETLTLIAGLLVEQERGEIPTHLVVERVESLVEPDEPGVRNAMRIALAQGLVATMLEADVPARGTMPTGGYL